MLVATFLKDLQSENVHEVVMCLTTLGNVMNPTIAASVMEPVSKLTSHTMDLVRKKAVIVFKKIKD